MSCPYQYCLEIDCLCAFDHFRLCLHFVPSVSILYQDGLPLWFCLLHLCSYFVLQEYYLIALSQPRQDESSSSSSGSEEEEGDAEAELEGMDSPAARMYHKSMVFQQDQKRIREEATKTKRSAFRIPVSPNYTS